MKFTITVLKIQLISEQDIDNSCSLWSMLRWPLCEIKYGFRTAPKGTATLWLQQSKAFQSELDMQLDPNCTNQRCNIVMISRKNHLLNQMGYLSLNLNQPKFAYVEAQQKCDYILKCLCSQTWIPWRFCMLLSTGREGGKPGSQHIQELSDS